jgi:putative ABC transport system substrate-binding protein
VSAFRQGLQDGGFIVGENVVIEYRGANLQFTLLPALAADLVQRQVDVIFAAYSIGPMRAAKSATTTIPIVFYYGGDPVRDGLVTSLSRPGGNVTGVTGLQTELANKRLGLLHELIPRATTVALLTGATQLLPDHGMVAGARMLGLDVVVFRARSDHDFERAFATFAERLIGAIFVDNYPLFSPNSRSLVALAERYKIPAVYPFARFVRQGGLISYGPDVPAAYRQAAGRVPHRGGPSRAAAGACRRSGTPKAGGDHRSRQPRCIHCQSGGAGHTNRFYSGH